MRLAAAAVASLIASGCVATRYSPPLDRELTEAGKRLLEATTVRVTRETTPGNILDDSVAHAVEGSQATLTVLRNQSDTWPGRGFQCFEPLLYVLSVGIIPAECTNDYAFEAVLDDGNSTVPFHREHAVTQIQGWVSGLLALLPVWDSALARPRPSGP